MNNLLEIKNLTKSYKDFKLKNLNLTLPGGCIMGLIGENGAGKSTTIKLILDMCHKDIGSITVLGRDSERLSPEIREQIGLVMDKCCFPEVFTVKDVNLMLKNMYKTWDEQKFNEYAETFSLPKNKKIKDFSRGMSMKLSIAAALSHGSRLLILDEATSGLDPVVRDEILDIFFEFIQDDSHSILMSSHILSDLEKVCDYMAFLHKGKLLLCEEKDVLMERFAILKCAESQYRELPKDAVVGVRKNSFGVEALVHREKVRQGLALEPACLEDIMLYHVKGEK